MPARHLAAGVILWFAAFISMMGWTVDTCTGNAPDSLMMGGLVIPLNLLGVVLLAWQPRTVWVIIVALLPLAASFSYIGDTMRLLTGTPACNLVSSYGPWEPTGDEGFYGALWLCSALVLWVGIALALIRGYRPRNHDQ